MVEQPPGGRKTAEAGITMQVLGHCKPDPPDIREAERTLKLYGVYAMTSIVLQIQKAMQEQGRIKSSTCKRAQNGFESRIRTKQPKHVFYV